MPSRFRVLQSRAARPRGLRARWLPALLRVLGLVFLLLLPMQMRAGADDPHPHALLQLILDVRDGAIDHHAEDGHADGDDGLASAGGSHQHDVPTFGESNTATGGMAMLAAVVALFLMPAPDTRISWPPPARWFGRSPALDPPPPRIESI